MLVRGIIAATVLATGCPAPEGVAPIPPVSAGKVHVRVFTQPSPVRSVAAAGKYVFVATDHDVERWSGDGDAVRSVMSERCAGTARSTPAGECGGIERIVALAPDANHKWLWILTESGLGHYDAARDVFTPPAQRTAIDYADGAVLAPADDGAWVGTSHGLFHVGDTWEPTAITEPVRAVLRVHDWLWIASATGLVARKPNGDFVRIPDSIADPRLLVALPGERVLAIGSDEQGHERLAFGHELAWTTYRALPDVKWDAATARGNGVVVMGGDRVYRIAPADPALVRPLLRDGMRLVPLTTATSDWTIDPIDIVLPPGATALGATGDQLLIGTRDLGTARYRESDVRPLEWMRRRQMFDDATSLSVACAQATDCWIATGAHGAWHWAKDRFVTGGPADQLVLAVVRDPAGPIYALHRAADDAAIHLSKIDRTGWTPVGRIAITTPGDAPEISFARFASPGVLWVGLRYRDGRAHRPFGVAVIDVPGARVAYHQDPVGVIDGDVRGGTGWFATTEGVARLAGGQVKLWTRDEHVRAVAMRLDGTAAIATDAGAGIWDGKSWDFPAALRFEVKDIVATKHGQLWMATERGIVAWDGKNVRRVDIRRGLAENEVLDLAIDQFDRVWARGPGSLTLVSQ